MAICVFYSTLLNFVFAGRLGISPIALGLMCMCESVWAKEEATVEEEKNGYGVCTLEYQFGGCFIIILWALLLYCATIRQVVGDVG